MSKPAPGINNIIYIYIYIYIFLIYYSINRIEIRIVGEYILYSQWVNWEKEWNKCVYEA